MILWIVTIESIEHYVPTSINYFKLCFMIQMSNICQQSFLQRAILWITFHEYHKDHDILLSGFCEELLWHVKNNLLRMWN